jgi:Retrotransposon gag protein
MFATAPRKHRSEMSKILAAGSYLKGDPKKWFSNYFLLPEDQRPAWFGTWALFRNELHRYWGLEDPEAAAKSEVRGLIMSDKDHVTYFASKFRSIQSQLPSWSDRNLHNAFLAALAPRIRTQFVSAGRVPPNGLDTLIIAAEELNHAYWTDFEASRNI